MSFLKLGMAATPGNERKARLMSRPPPGFRLISFVPMLRTLNGASSTVPRDSTTTSAASTATADSTKRCIHHRRACRRGLHLEGRVRGVPEERNNHVVHPRCDARQGVVAVEVCGGACGVALEHHRGKWQRLVGGGVDHLPQNHTSCGRAVLRPCISRAQKERRMQKMWLEWLFSRLGEVSEVHPTNLPSSPFVRSTQVQIQGLPQLVQLGIFLHHHVVPLPV